MPVPMKPTSLCVSVSGFRQRMKVVGARKRILTVVLGFWFGAGKGKWEIGFLGFREEMEGEEICGIGGKERNMLELKRKEDFDIVWMMRRWKIILMLGN